MSGSTYYYNSPSVPLTEARFASVLSRVTSTVVPVPVAGQTTAPYAAPGDTLASDAYNAAGPSTFSYPVAPGMAAATPSAGYTAS